MAKKPIKLWQEEDAPEWIRRFAYKDSRVRNPHWLAFVPPEGPEDFPSSDGYEVVQIVHPKGKILVLNYL